MHTNLVIISGSDGRAELVECGNVGCWGPQVRIGHQHTANLRSWLMVVEL